MPKLSPSFNHQETTHKFQSLKLIGEEITIPPPVESGQVATCGNGAGGANGGWQASGCGWRLLGLRVWWSRAREGRARATQREALAARRGQQRAAARGSSWRRRVKKKRKGEKESSGEEERKERKKERKKKKRRERKEKKRWKFFFSRTILK